MTNVPRHLDQSPLLLQVAPRWGGGCTPLPSGWGDGHRHLLLLLVLGWPARRIRSIIQTKVTKPADRDAGNICSYIQERLSYRNCGVVSECIYGFFMAGRQTLALSSSLMKRKFRIRRISHNKISAQFIKS